MPTTVSEPTAPARSTAPTVTIITELAALEALRPEWMDLLERSDANGIMLTPMWLLPWWRVWGPLEGRQLRVVLVRDGERRLIGLAPLLRRRFWHRGLVPLRRLEALGSGERPGEKVCSDYLNVVAERGAERLVAAALAEAVGQGRLGGWDDLVLPGMDGEGAMPDLLVEAFQRLGASASALPVDACPYIPLPATWEAYLKAQPTKRRNLIVRSIRDFEKWAGPDVRLLRANAETDLAEGRRVLRSLHEERWRAEGQDGVFSASRFTAFHEAVMPEMLRAGALEFAWVTVRGEPVAVEYNFAWNGRISTYQAGRKMNVPNNIRLGLVLHAWAIRRAIEAGLREYDLLAGVSHYKLTLAGSTRPLVDFQAVRPGLADAAVRAVEIGVGWVKKGRDEWRRKRESTSAAAAADAKEGEA